MTFVKENPVATLLILVALVIIGAIVLGPVISIIKTILMFVGIFAIAKVLFARE